ncbi:MAG TPA: homogentisate 1,2-dioxygenase [Pirellulaceae bacterium]
MPHYMRLGLVPPKRHIQHRRPEAESFEGEGLYYEHVLTTNGFDRSYTIMYHLRPPTRIREIEAAGTVELHAAEGLPLRPHHLRTGGMPRAGDGITGRIPLMFNDDLVVYRCRPQTSQQELYRNGAGDEVIFVQAGQGTLDSTFGRLKYRRGDYLVIPRTTVYRLCPDNVAQEDYLILESRGPVRLPHRYFNPDGQLMMGAPYYERDFHGPTELKPVDDGSDTVLLVKDGNRLTRMVLASHPLDVVGWDGLVYPFTFNAWDFEPLTGTVHLPPPYQQTFECPGFVICTFAPRHLDHHPDAVKVPYAHSNVQADEVLFYVDGQFGSRKGVELCSLTLHPGGIPHGPHPGTIKASMHITKTQEMAVMFDTDRSLHLTRNAMDFDDPKYPFSWL